MYCDIPTPDAVSFVAGIRITLSRERERVAEGRVREMIHSFLFTEEFIRIGRFFGFRVGFDQLLQGLLRGSGFP